MFSYNASLVGRHRRDFQNPFENFLLRIPPHAFRTIYYLFLISERKAAHVSRSRSLEVLGRTYLHALQNSDED